MSLIRTLAAMAALAVSGVAFADTECADPIAQWKPRELLRQQVEQRGWTVRRIKVDDGCYEVRGLDRMGNKIKAKYAPATLRIRSLEVEFGPAGDASDYVGPAQSKGNRREPARPASKGNVPAIEMRQTFRPVDVNRTWKGFESPPKSLRETPAFRPGYSLRSGLKAGVSTGVRIR